MKLDLAGDWSSYCFDGALEEGVARVRQHWIWLVGALAIAGLIGWGFGSLPDQSSAMVSVVQFLLTAIVQFAIAIRLSGATLNALNRRTLAALALLYLIVAFVTSVGLALFPNRVSINQNNFNPSHWGVVAGALAFIAFQIWLSIRTACGIIVVLRDECFSWKTIIAPTQGREWSIVKMGLLILAINSVFFFCIELGLLAIMPEAKAPLGLAITGIAETLVAALWVGVAIHLVRVNMIASGAENDSVASAQLEHSCS